MRTLITVICLFLHFNENRIEQIIIRPIEYKQKDYILEAIIETESNNRNVVGQTGDVGYLQITDIFVKDVNRILGYDKYDTIDRWNKQKSIEMYYIIQAYYNPNYDFNLACYYHHRPTKTKEHLRYINMVKNNLMKIIIKECSENHKTSILNILNQLKECKHKVIEVKSKDINSTLSYLNTKDTLSLSISNKCRFSNNMNNLIKNLM